MNRNLILVIVFSVTITIIWALIIFLSGSPECPDRLPDNYYFCETNLDCSYHPKYECINDQPLNCVINEDLSAQQTVAPLLECKCVNNECKTQVIH